MKERPRTTARAMRLTCAVLCLLAGAWAQTALAVRGGGPREIRLTWQFVAAEPEGAERNRARWLALILPDDHTLLVDDVEIEDITGDMPGRSIYYDQFGTSQFRLNVVGPSELIEALRQGARPGARASMVALYYRAIGRLMVLDFQPSSAG